MLPRFGRLRRSEKPADVSSSRKHLSTARKSTASHPGHELFDLGRLDGGSRTRNEAIIRGLCQTAYLGEGTALSRSLGRYKIFVDTRDIGLSSHLMLDGYWEMWVTEAIARLVRPDMVVADIGANLGYFSLMLADLVGAGGHVHCFEPNPRIAARLRNSLDINGFAARSTLHQVALGAEDGAQMVFVVPDHEPKNAYIQPFQGTVPEGGAILSTTRLDSIPGADLIDFAKIDVEGAEELIWSGAQALLEGSRLRTIVLEFTPGRYADPAAFLDRILAYGFGLGQIDPHLGIRPTTREAILAGDAREDVMLLLQR